VKGSGHGLIEYTIPILSLEGLKKSKKDPVRTVSIPTNVQIGHTLNTCLQHYDLGELAQSQQLKMSMLLYLLPVTSFTLAVIL
jgi:hypothetical protein